jgi:mannose-6-phosphate isomerase-like protein (cupin superfamily)
LIHECEKHHNMACVCTEDLSPGMPFAAARLSTIIKRRRGNKSMLINVSSNMLRTVSEIALIAGLVCLPAWAQAPTPADADKQAARLAQGYAPVPLWDRGDVRASRVEIKPGGNRAIHQHDDVKFHLFIPLTGTMQITIGSDRPVPAPVGQAFYIKGGTPHGFKNLGSTPASAMEIFVKEGASTASLDALGALVAGLRTAPQ